MVEKTRTDTDYVEVTLRLPKPVVEFYEAYAHFAKEEVSDMLTEIIVKDVAHILDDFPAICELKGFVKRYGLEQYVSSEGFPK